MMTQRLLKPGDYAPYYEKYIALVPSGDFLEILDTQLQEWEHLVSGLSEQQGDFRYGADKWSVKEILGHISDAERIFAYRLLRIARADQTPLASFEQDDYVKTGKFGARKLSDILEEFAAVRRATIALIRSLDTEAWFRRGTASQKEITVTALAFIIAGHDLHHRRIFEERYVPALAGNSATAAG